MLVQKNYRWIWTSVDRENREYIDFHLGNRGTETGKKLWNRVKDYAQGFVMTDYWKSYKEMIPSEQLIQSKKETYTVESYNGVIRHFLARFRRKTKCYSKSEEMIEYSLLLLMAKRNNELYIQSY
jgi:insertion element IS1 protein InsB